MYGTNYFEEFDVLPPEVEHRELRCLHRQQPSARPPRRSPCCWLLFRIQQGHRPVGFPDRLDCDIHFVPSHLSLMLRRTLAYLLPSVGLMRISSGHFHSILLVIILSRPSTRPSTVLAPRPSTVFAFSFFLARLATFVQSCRSSLGFFASVFTPRTSSRLEARAACRFLFRLNVVHTVRVANSPGVRCFALSRSSALRFSSSYCLSCLFTSFSASRSRLMSSIHRQHEFTASIKFKKKITKVMKKFWKIKKFNFLQSGWTNLDD